MEKVGDAKLRRSNRNDRQLPQRRGTSRQEKGRGDRQPRKDKGRKRLDSPQVPGGKQGLGRGAGIEKTEARGGEEDWPRGRGDQGASLAKSFKRRSTPKKVPVTRT